MMIIWNAAKNLGFITLSASCGISEERMLAEVQQLADEELSCIEYVLEEDEAEWFSNHIMSKS
jgi:hypothetical protein